MKPTLLLMLRAIELVPQAPAAFDVAKDSGGSLRIRSGKVKRPSRVLLQPEAAALRMPFYFFASL